MTYFFDSGFAAAARQTWGRDNGFIAPYLPLGDIEGRRDRVRKLATRRAAVSQALLEKVSTTNYKTTNADGSKIPLRWYKSKSKMAVDESDSESKNIDTSAVVFLHGGGLICGSIDDFDALVATYVCNTGVPFLAVDYRLAPEHRYPAALEDAYTALVWLHEHARDLQIDTRRIAIMGTSAGAGLAACASLLARARSGPPIAKQILICPMLNHRNIKPQAIIPDTRARSLEQFLSWSYEDNETGWAAYLGENKSEEVSETAAGVNMKDATDMPELYLDVGGLDIFLGEGVDYAAKHLKAGVVVELHVYPGVPHSFESFAPTAPVSKRARDDRFRAISTIRPSHEA